MDYSKLINFDHRSDLINTDSKRRECTVREISIYKRGKKSISS
jgi:hypothetical protein